MSVWPSLFGFSALSFSGRTIASIAIMDHPDPEHRAFRILRHGVIGGSIAAIRSLDSITDLQVGYLLVQKVCDHFFGLEILFGIQKSVLCLGNTPASM